MSAREVSTLARLPLIRRRQARQHGGVPMSPQITGVEEPLSCLCDCRISKSRAPTPNTLTDHNTPPGSPRIPPNKPTAAGRLGGCVRRAVQRLCDILKTTAESVWSGCSGISRRAVACSSQGLGACTCPLSTVLLLQRGSGTPQCQFNKINFRDGS